MYGNNRKYMTHVSHNRQKRTVIHDDKHTKMKKLIDGLLMHIKAFEGDVFGGVVRDYKTQGLVYVRDINCRIDSIMLTIFLQTLNLHYKVRELSSDFSGKFVDYVKKLYVTFKDDENIVYTYLDIIVVSRVEWLRLPCDFDVNLLAESASSVYVRSNYTNMNKVVDKYSFVLDRVKKSTFAQLESLAAKTPEHACYFVDRAFKMSMRGWIMDDFYLGSNTYVMNAWMFFVNTPTFVRTEYDSQKLELMKSMDECAICSEKFKDTDIVINTKCNHNFHWSQAGCNRQTSGGAGALCCKGLQEWIKLDNSSCPLCRKSMF